jgi:hypothetical protein
MSKYKYKEISERTSRFRPKKSKQTINKNPVNLQEWAWQVSARAKAIGLLKYEPCNHYYKGPCDGPLHMHHEDYRLPLKIICLCKKHHNQHHNIYGPAHHKNEQINPKERKKYNQILKDYKIIAKQQNSER